MSGGFVCGLLPTLALLASLAKCQSRQRADYTIRTAEGHVSQLECDLLHKEGNLTFTWSRGDNQTLETSTSRIQIRGNSLWFLPTRLSDNGSYTCTSRWNSSVSVETKVLLSVGREPCPGQSEVRIIQWGSNGTLICSQKDVIALGQAAHETWWKDCQPINMQGEKMELLNVSDSDTGNYTCQVNFTYEGKDYVASRTTLLQVIKEPRMHYPKVIHPRNETVSVYPGVKIELVCTAIIGMTAEGSVYWTMNDSFIENYPQLNQSVTFEKRESGELHGVCILSISEVRPEFFHVPLHCVVTNPLGRDTGLVWLIPDHHRDLLIPGLILLVVSVVIVCTAYKLFKVDVVLACRRMRRSRGRIATQDGKLYDAYVSYLHGDPSRAEAFALRVLPEVLEQQHGYKLFIYGRDSRLGEVDRAVMADTVSKCRRVLLVLSAWNSAGPDLESSVPLLPESQDGPSDAQRWRELCDVVVHDGVKVILVETDTNVCYSRLPELLQAIRQRQGALRWSPITLPNARFWKSMRYLMSPERGSAAASTPETD